MHVLSVMSLTPCFSIIQKHVAPTHLDARTGAHAATPAGVADLRSPSAAVRCRALLHLSHAGRRRPADPAWARSWVGAGAVSAIIAGTAAAAPSEAAQQAAFAFRALVPLLQDRSAGGDAAAQLLAEAVAVMQECGPQAVGPALYQLLVAALDLPVTCKVPN